VFFLTQEAVDVVSPTASTGDEVKLQGKGLTSQKILSHNTPQFFDLSRLRSGPQSYSPGNSALVSKSLNSQWEF